MPTLEERIAALERAQAVMRSEQIDTRQIEERMSALELQIAEQRRRFADQERNTDTLTRAVTQQFNTITTSLNARFDTQTAAIRAQFGDVNMAITALSVTATSFSLVPLHHYRRNKQTEDLFFFLNRTSFPHKKTAKMPRKG